MISKISPKRFLLSCVSLTALSLQIPLLGSSSGQGQKARSDRNIQHEVTVTLKLVQVYVHDKRGSPVTDLVRSDFELWDNGRAKQITSFENHTAPPSEAKPREETMSASPKRASPTLNRKFIMIFDYFRNDPAGIARAKKAALHFLEQRLLPGDEVAVVSFSPQRGLVLHQNLTLNHHKAKDAVQMTKGMPYFKTFDANFEERLSLEDSEGDIGEAGGGQIMDLRGILKDFFESMKELARSLRYTPGFKNIVFFSGGLSYALIYDKTVQVFPGDIQVSGLGEDIGVGLLRNRNSSWVLDHYQDMIREFTSANCPVYAVDTEGNRAHLNRNLRGDHALKELSDRTGGRYFDDVNDYEVIAELIQNTTRNYYVLGYEIDEKEDGKFHDIKVKVKRKGIEVVAQRGYFNPRPFSEYSPFEKRLHLLDLAFSENPDSQAPESFPLLTLLAPQDQGAGCLLLSEIRLDSMPDAAGKRAEIISLAVDKAGAVAAARRGEIGFHSLPSRRIYHYAWFSLNPGTYECKTIIRNLETGKSAVGAASLTVPEPLSAGLRLYPLLLLLPDREAFYLEASKKSGTDEALSLQKIYPVLPAPSRPVMDELDEGTRTILAGVRCSVPNISDPRISLSALSRSMNTDEEFFLDHRVTAVRREGPDIVLLVELDISDLRADAYELCLDVWEERSQSRDQTRRLLRIGKHVLQRQPG